MSDDKRLTVGSLFSGIGGLDLGLERAGMRVIWHSEIDPYACRVLNKHWPEVPNHGNIKEINWQEVERPDVICGGYPCQPFSLAGIRRGEDDERHLWPWVREAIRALRPRYAILENVRGHLSLGGTTVIGELASIGYDAEWRIVSAASVGAAHRRDRIIIVAYPQSEHSNGISDHSGDREQSEATAKSGDSGWQTDVADSQSISSDEQLSGVMSGAGRAQGIQDSPRGGSRNVAHSNSERLEGERAEQQTAGALRGGQVAHADSWEDGWRIRGIQPDRATVFGGENLRRGTAQYAGWQWWETEPDVGRVAHGVPSRVDRLRGLGNAVVPQVAEVIGRLVVAHAEADHGA